MNVKQNFSLLVFPKRENKQQQQATLYARITIDGLDDEFSLSIKLQYKYWLPESKTVDQAHPGARNINARIKAAETDLERHFLLVQEKMGLRYRVPLENPIKPLLTEGILLNRKRNMSYSRYPLLPCFGTISGFVKSGRR